MRDCQLMQLWLTHNNREPPPTLSPTPLSLPSSEPISFALTPSFCFNRDQFLFTPFLSRWMASVSTSFTHLYGTHHGWLLGLLRRRLNDRWDAADLAHDTFIRLLSRPPTETDHARQRSYLATIARGLCIDHWRRRQLEKAWLDSLALRPESTQPSPEQRAIIVETLYEVDAMLARLPSKVREAFLLAQLHGMPYKAIGEQLGVGERMVKKYMAQALLHCAILEAELDGMLVQ